MLRSIERSRQLRKRLKSDLFPLLEAHGFFPLKHTSLFYEFGRLRNGQLHVHEIMWDKYHRPRFIVNFGRAQVEVNDGGIEGIRNPYMDQWLPNPDAGTGVLAAIKGWFPVASTCFRWWRAGSAVRHGQDMPVGLRDPEVPGIGSTGPVCHDRAR